MTQKMYVIFDSVAIECQDPFVANNDGVALRQFGFAMAKVDAEMKQEFHLVCIGVIDKVSMLIDGAGCPRNVNVALNDEQLEAVSGE